MPSTYPLDHATAWLDDATADFDETEREWADTAERARWHEKTTVVVAFGSLAVMGLAVLVIAVLTVSNDSRHPDASRHPVVVSTSPAPTPATSVPPSPLPIAAEPPPAEPAPTAAQPPPTEAPPAPATAIHTPAPPPGGPQSAWSRLRHWLWAHQHPAG